MQITLKKAADLSRAAIEAAAKIKVSPDVTISVYQTSTAQETISKALGEIRENEKSAEALINVGFSIRKKVGVVNATCGVDEALTDRANIDHLERRVSDLLNQARMVDFEDEAVVEKRRGVLVEKLNTSQTFARYDERFSVGVISPVVVKDYEAKLSAMRRRKNDLKDKIAGLNLNNHITLDDAEVSVLKKFGIIE